MLKSTAPLAPRSRVFLSAAVLGCALFGVSALQAQETTANGETETEVQDGIAVKDSEKSDTRRGHTAGDSDGDGYADAALHAGHAGDPIPGIDITRAADGADEGTEAQKRKKMKRLKRWESEPLEPMDETDTCPTLPCPTP